MPRQTAGTGGRPRSASKKRKARRTPTEIGQTVPTSAKGERRKARALSAGQPVSRVYTSRSAPRRGATSGTRAVRRARRIQRAQARRERTRAVKRIVRKEPQVRDVRIRPTRTPKLEAGTLTVPKRTARKLTSEAPQAATSAIRSAVKAPTVQKQHRKFTTGRKRLPGLTKAQTRRAATVLKEGLKADASPKELLAATETGIVEAPNFENPTSAESDRDSAGWRQERQSIYGPETAPKGPRNVRAAAKRFFAEARSDPGTREARTAGQLAQAVQGSAFPERYDEAKGQAKPIVREYVETLSKGRDWGRYAALSKPSGKPPPKKTVSRFKAIVDEAEKIDSANLPYLWGGGHVEGKIPGPRKQAYDCSGAVSRVLQASGYKLPRAMVSGEFSSWGKSGPGAVTIYANEGHVFMKIGNRYWGTSSANRGGGAGFIPRSVGESEAKSGSYAVRHVPGLGKEVARRMGVRVDQAPGLRYSAGGGTATLTDSAIVRSPGASSKPIRLEARRARRSQRERRKLVSEIIAKEPPASAEVSEAPETRHATYVRTRSRALGL